MAYLTKQEYKDFGFGEATDFDSLLKRAEMAVDLYTRDFYSYNDFERDFESRRRAVKRAVAFQVAYLDSTGIMTAEDKQAVASMSVGRTSVSYQNGSQSSSQGLSLAARYNLSRDAENWLKSAGFGFVRVEYDR